jgi:predicted nucleic acid-binding protein
MKWLDTNILIRYLTGDDPVKARACLELFKRVADGVEELTTSETIIAEVTYVLSSQYDLTHAEIADRLQPLLEMSGLKLTHKRVVQQAMERYGGSTHLDFEDALSVEHMNRIGIHEIISYDRDFDRVSEISRLEP